MNEKLDTRRRDALADITLGELVKAWKKAMKVNPGRSDTQYTHYVCWELGISYPSARKYMDIARKSGAVS